MMPFYITMGGGTCHANTTLSVTHSLEKNPKKVDIPSGCTIDELKDLIKQVAPQGIPPDGIHESQTVRRLFFRKPGHYEYSDKVIKFEIIELKTDDDMLKVLVQSNYWKQFGPISIRSIFSL